MEVLTLYSHVYGDRMKDSLEIIGTNFQNGHGLSKA
jgi:hypothetical protein